MENKTIVVWFSCGAASAVAAKKTIELYGSENTIRIVNNPIKEEDSDNLRFLKDVEKWLCVKIESAINKNYPNASITEVFEKRQYMSGISGAPCTLELKKKARQQWEENNEFDFMVMGFTSDENARYERFKKTERGNILNVLGDLDIDKQECFDILNDAGISLPLMYLLKYPNANCPGCVKATSPTYWNHVRINHPDVFKDRCEQSRRIGVKLVRYKGKRIFLDELPEGAKGNKLQFFKMPDCGIFCEEKI